jgi:hypothetical protein
MHNEEDLFGSLQVYNISLCRNIQPGYGTNQDVFFCCVPEIVSPGVKWPHPESEQFHLGSGFRITGAISPLPMRLHCVKNDIFIYLEKRKRTL